MTCSRRRNGRRRCSADTCPGTERARANPQLNVVVEPWRAHPLAWIHRGEARAVAAELRRAGYAVRMVEFSEAGIGALPSGPLLLRVSDPVMLVAAQALGRASIPYFGPGAAAMARCYDKWEAYRLASRAGIDCPATALASDAGKATFPLILKPRQGSDSIGMRLVGSGPIPVRARTDRYLAQERIVGAELTIAVIGGRVGMPLRLALPEGTPYSFWRKYLARPARAPLADTALAAKVRELAVRIAGVLAIDWAARIDLMHETATGSLRFLECDVAPLVGRDSAFAASLAAAGIGRTDQLRLLIDAR